MIAKESGGTVLIDFPGSDPHGETIEQAIISRQQIAIDQQECDGGNNGRAFIAIHESMISTHAKNIGRGNIGMVRFAVKNLVLRVGQS